MSNQSVASGSLISSSSTTLTADAIAHTSTIPSPRTFNVVLTGFHNGSKISTEVAVREGERLPRLCVRGGIPIVVYDDDGIDDDANKDETYTDARADEDEDEDDEEESWHDTDDESTDEREAMGIQVPLRPKLVVKKRQGSRGLKRVTNCEIVVRDATVMEEEDWMLFRRNAVAETQRNWAFAFSGHVKGKHARNSEGNKRKHVTYKCHDDGCEARMKVNDFSFVPVNVRCFLTPAHRI